MSTTRRVPVPVGWGDHESAELDAFARRQRAERERAIAVGMPRSQMGEASRKANRARPRRLACGDWTITFIVKRQRYAGRFDTKRAAEQWRDQIMKEAN